MKVREVTQAVAEAATDGGLDGVEVSEAAKPTISTAGRSFRKGRWLQICGRSPDRIANQMASFRER
jgi:hypothetical protein